jgi:tripartite-type tricarboxylate transporter receptor subunit TctC
VKKYQMVLRRVLILILILSLWSISSVYAVYPEKPIKIIIPYPKGGATGILIEIVANEMEKILGKPIIFQYSDKKVTPEKMVLEASLAPKDGYTLVVGNLGTHAASKPLFGIKLKYDPIESFTPIGMIGVTPMFMVIHNNIKTDDGKIIDKYIDPNCRETRVDKAQICDFVDYVRSKKQIKIAHAGEGSTAYFAALVLEGMLKTDLTFVPFSGSGAALESVQKGDADIMIDQSTSALPYVQAGKVRAILYMQNRPYILTLNNQEYKIIPFLSDIELQEFQMYGWNAVFAPAGVDKGIQAILNQALIKALEDCETKEQLEDVYNTVLITSKRNTPDELVNFMLKEQKKMDVIFRNSNINNECNNC